MRAWAKKYNATHFPSPFWSTIQQGINKVVMMAQTSDQTIQLPAINNRLNGFKINMKSRILLSRVQIISICNDAMCRDWFRKIGRVSEREREKSLVKQIECTRQSTFHSRFIQFIHLLIKFLLLLLLSSVTLPIQQSISTAYTNVCLFLKASNKSTTKYYLPASCIALCYATSPYKQQSVASMP